MGKNVFMEKDKGKKRGKSSTLLTGSSLVLMQMMASGLPSQNVSADFWEYLKYLKYLNPFNWNWAWFATLFASCYGSSARSERGLNCADNSQKNEGKMNKYIEEARKELEKFYSETICVNENSFNFSKKTQISNGTGCIPMPFWADINLDQEENVYYFSSNLSREEYEFKKGEDFIKFVKKHTKNMEKVEKIIEQMKRISKTGRYSLKQGDFEVSLTLCNKVPDFYYEENKTLEKMELNLEDMSITLYQKGSTSDGEKCSLESLREKVNFLLNSIEDYNKKCIETAKNCVDKVFGEANWKQNKEEKKWERSIEIEGINLPVSVETSSYYGSELCVLGKRLLGFSCNSEDSKASYIKEIKEFKDFFEKYTKKFMSFGSKNNFKPSFDVGRGRLVLVSSKPDYGVKVSGDMLGGGEDKLISKIEFDVLERKIYFWTNGKIDGKFDFMSLYRRFGQKYLDSEEERSSEEKFDEFLDFLNSKELEEFKPQKEVEDGYSSGEEINE